MLRRVEPVRTFEAVVAALRDLITSGRLQPGDRLPSQRELAEQLGVSRNSVVQAIRILDRAGLVEVRPGASGGAFVKRLDGSELIDTLRLLLELDQISIDEVIELRAVLEGQNAYWAARRRSSAELERLRELATRVGELAAELSGGDQRAWPMLLAEDALFHRAVADAAHNRAASAVMVGALGVLNRQLGKLPPSCAPEIVASLDEITDAIAAPDPEAAREQMTEHIYYFAWEVAEAGKPWPRER